MASPISPYSAVGGCGRFLGDWMKGFSYVRSRGTRACGGLVFHHADDRRAGGGVSGLSGQAVLGTLAGGGSPVCRPYGQAHHPPGNEGQGRSGWCRAACGGSRPPGNSAWASAPSATGPGHAAGAAWPALQAGNRDAAQSGRPAASRRRPSAVDAGDAGAPRRRVGEPEPEDAVMREVVEVAGKDPGAGLRRLSDRGKTLLIDRLGPACSPGSMTCLPGIAPGAAYCRHAGLGADGCAGLRVRVAGAFAASGGGCGYRGVKAMPRTHVSGKAVRGIVAGDGLVAHAPERRGCGSCGGETTPAPGSLADRGFTAGRPNGKWLAGTARDQDRGREGRASRRRSTATTAGSPRIPPGSIPTRSWPTGCRRKRSPRRPGRVSPGAFRPRPPLPVARMAGPHGTVRPDAVDGREGLFSGQRRRGGVLRTREDGIRLSRALGGTYPRRGARPGRRLHPLARPRAHRTVAWLDESGTIPSEPGNGCVIISKKMSAAPYSIQTCIGRSIGNKIRLC